MKIHFGHFFRAYPIHNSKKSKTFLTLPYNKTWHLNNRLNISIFKILSSFWKLLQVLIHYLNDSCKISLFISFYRRGYFQEFWTIFALSIYRQLILDILLRDSCAVSGIRVLCQKKWFVSYSIQIEWFNDSNKTNRIIKFPRDFKFNELCSCVNSLFIGSTIFSCQHPKNCRSLDRFRHYICCYECCPTAFFNVKRQSSADHILIGTRLR